MSTSLSDDRLAELARLGRVIARAQTRATDLGAERDVILRDLAGAGVPYSTLATASGLSKGRIGQIVGRKDAGEE